MTPKFFTYLKHISDAGLPLLVFLLPWQTRWIAEQGMINGNPSEYLTTSIYGVDIFIILLLVLDIFVSYCWIKNNKHIFKTTRTFNELKRVLSIGAIGIGWCALSVGWASDAMLALQRVAWFLLAAGLVLLVIRYEQKAQLIYWFVMGLMLSAWLGIWQFVFQSSFANKWLGLAAHNPQAGGTSIVEIYSASGSPIRWLRAYGSFDHPIVFGTAMAVGILLVLWTISVEKAEKKRTYFLYIALASMSAGLFVSLSRDAWAGLVLGIIVTAFCLLRNKLRGKLRNTIKPRVLVAIIFVIMVAMYPAQFLMRSGGPGRLEVKSIDDRAQYFQQGKDLIKNNLLLGTGIGNYINTLKNNNANDPAWTYQPVHDVPMLVWAETGLFGMLAVVALFTALCLYAWSAKNVLSIALLASLIPAILFDHWLWDLHFGILLLGCMLGILMNDNKETI